MILLKKPTIENCTTYYTVDNENITRVDVPNHYISCVLPKDIFSDLQLIIDSSKKISFRGYMNFVLHKGIMVKYDSSIIYMVITKENIVYINDSSYYPKTWITLIRKAVKALGLNPNKQIKLIPNELLKEMFLLQLSIEFDDSSAEVQKQVMLGVQNELNILYPKKEEPIITEINEL